MTTTADRSAPADEGTGTYTHRQVLVVLSGLLIGMFLAALDQTIVSTAMRTIADRLDGQTQQAWVTTAYLITSTIATPLYGKLSDNYGRKQFYLFAIAIFVVGSMLCGTAQSIYQLAAYRAIQGIGAGGLMSLAFTIIGDLVSPRERGRYSAYFMSVFGTSSVLGPVLGGALAGQGSILGIDGWRWIFYVNVPIGLLALVVVSLNLHLPVRRSTQRVDLLGAGLLTAAVIPVLLVAEKGHDWGWSSPLTLGLLAAGVVALALFIPWERRLGLAAILPLHIFRNSIFTTSSAVAALTGLAMFGGLVNLPLFLQIVRGASPTEAGLQMLPLMVGIIAASGVTGRMMSRTGRYKVFPVIGTAVMFLTLLAMSRLQAETPLPLIMLGMVSFGIGLGLSMQPLVLGVQNAMPPAEMGVATGSVIFFRSMGGTLGAAVSLAVLFGTVTSHIRERAVQAGLPQSVIDRFGSASALNDTSVLDTLPGPVRRAVLDGFADSMSLSFLVVAFTLVPAFLLSLRIKEIPLRGMGGLSADAEAKRVEAETAVL